MDTTITSRSSDLPWPHTISSNSTQSSVTPYPMDNPIHLSYDHHHHHHHHHHRSDPWHGNHDDDHEAEEEEEDTDDGSHLLKYPSRHPGGFDGADRSGLMDYGHQSHHDHVDAAAVDDEDFADHPHVDAYAGYRNNSGFLHEDEDAIGYGDDQVVAGSSYGYNLNGNWVDSSGGQNIPDQIPIPIQTLTPTPTPPRRGVKRASDSISTEYNAGIVYDPARSNSPPQLDGSPTSLMQASGAGSHINNNHSNPSKFGKGSGTGSLFFKTKLCIKFRAGTCPYNSNCNFAHGMEELRKPPPGWEDMVAAQEAAAGSGVEASTGPGGGGGGRNNSSIKENSSGQLVLSGSESLRFRRTRRCKKFYSEEGCPYGERCNFLHDDQVKSRESNAISLGPGSGGGGGGVSTTTTSTTTTTNIGGANGAGERPSNWKTRMCNKWEMTGHCPFGQKCNFAHGAKELQMYSGAQTDYDTTTIVSNGLLSDNKQTTRIANSKLDHSSSSYVSTPSYTVDVHTTSRHKSTYLPTSKIEKPTKLLENWKGPSNQISRIYGDWLDDEE